LLGEVQPLGVAENAVRERECEEVARAAVAPAGHVGFKRADGHRPVGAAAFEEFQGCELVESFDEA
jgi:hypothetical protein